MAAGDLIGHLRSVDPRAGGFVRLGHRRTAPDRLWPGMSVVAVTRHGGFDGTRSREWSGPGSRPHPWGAWVAFAGGVPAESVLGRWRVAGRDPVAGHVTLHPFEPNPPYQPPGGSDAADLAREARSWVQGDLAVAGLSMSVVGEPASSTTPMSLLEGFRLADPQVLQDYRAFAAPLAHRVIRAYEPRRQLVRFLAERAGIPALEEGAGASSPGFYQDSWRLDMPVPSRFDVTDNGNDPILVALHETHHAEQFFAVLRYEAGFVESGDQLAGRHPRIPRRVIDAAMARPLRAGDDLYENARALHHGFDGYRTSVTQGGLAFGQRIQGADFDRQFDIHAAYSTLAVEAAAQGLETRLEQLGPMVGWDVYAGQLPQPPAGYDLSASPAGLRLTQHGQQPQEVTERPAGYDWLRLVVSTTDPAGAVAAADRILAALPEQAVSRLDDTVVVGPPGWQLVDLRPTAPLDPTEALALADGLTSHQRYLVIPRTSLTTPPELSPRVVPLGRTGLPTVPELATEYAFLASSRTEMSRLPRRSRHIHPAGLTVPTDTPGSYRFGVGWQLEQTPHSGLWTRPATLPDGVTGPVDTNGRPRPRTTTTTGATTSAEGRPRLTIGLPGQPTPALTMARARTYLRRHLGADADLNTDLDTVVHNEIHASPSLRPPATTPAALAGADAAVATATAERDAAVRMLRDHPEAVLARATAARQAAETAPSSAAWAAVAGIASSVDLNPALTRLRAAARTLASARLARDAAWDAAAGVGGPDAPAGDATAGEQRAGAAPDAGAVASAARTAQPDPVAPLAVTRVLAELDGLVHLAGEQVVEQEVDAGLYLPPGRLDLAVRQFARDLPQSPQEIVVVGHADAAGRLLVGGEPVPVDRLAGMLRSRYGERLFEVPAVALRLAVPGVSTAYALEVRAELELTVLTTNRISWPVPGAPDRPADRVAAEWAAGTDLNGGSWRILPVDSEPPSGFPAGTNLPGPSLALPEVVEVGPGVGGLARQPHRPTGRPGAAGRTTVRSR